MTRVLNRLPEYANLPVGIQVTFDPKDAVPERDIIKERRWKIPHLKPQDIRRRRNFREIQGMGHSWYCGTDTTLSGHEGAILSGLVVADFLGAPYPFDGYPWAKIQYNLVKELMGLYHPFEKINRGMSEIIYKLAKKLGLQPTQMAYLLLDRYG